MENHNSTKKSPVVWTISPSDIIEEDVQENVTLRNSVSDPELIKLTMKDHLKLSTTTPGLK